jgi:subtilisin family serine protease
LYGVLGAVGAVVIGAAITNLLFPNPPAPGAPPPSPPSGPQTLTQVQIQGTQGPPPPSPGGGQTTTTVQQLRPGCTIPAAGAPHVLNELVAVTRAGMSDAAADLIAAAHGMTRLESSTVFGRRMHRWRIDGGTPAEDMIRNVCAQVVTIQVNYLFQLTQQEQEPVNSDQYAPQKLNLVAAHRLARGDRVLVAVIDSEVDATHPDLAGAIVRSFEAAAEAERPHAHGTGMAGAIAAHRTMLGTAPRVGLLTVRAFGTRANNVEGTTFNILKGLDWAAAQGARVVNMSFAGPSDPRLRDALAKAKQKGMVLIAAAGNAGPSSPPLYPAADPNVIAVTATDPDDKIFPGANRGNHIAVAAPGVDILAPAPDGTYQFTTGTSVAAAEVSGVVALMIERNPALTPNEVKKILMDTAKRIGPKGKDFGAGLVDALQAVSAVKPPPAVH